MKSRASAGLTPAPTVMSCASTVMVLLFGSVSTTIGIVGMTDLPYRGIEGRCVQCVDVVSDDSSVVTIAIGSL